MKQDTNGSKPWSIPIFDAPLTAPFPSSMLMTLIASIAGLYFMGVSDTLISSDANRRPAPEVLLPLFDSEQRVQHAGSSVVGLAQKAILFDSRTLFMWAGSKVVAESVARTVNELVLSGAKFDFYRVIDNMGLLHSELDSVSLIFHRHLDNLKIDRKSHGVKVIHHDGDVIHFSGSGLFDFADSTSVAVGNAPLDGNLHFIHKWIARTLDAIMREAFSGEPLEFMYGGWFEFVLNDAGDTFVKVPYLIKFWTLTQNHLDETLPSIFSWYNNDHLFIRRAMSHRYNVCVVSDPLKRKPLSDTLDPWKPSQEPSFQIHVVQMPEKNATKIFIQSQSAQKYRLRVRDGGVGVDVEYDQSLIEEFEQAFQGGSVNYHLSRAFGTE